MKKLILLILAIIFIVAAAFIFPFFNSKNKRVQEAEVRLENGRKLAAAGNVEEAVGEFELAFLLNPTLWEARYLIAGEDLKANKLPEAVEGFAQVLKIKPDLVEAYTALAISYYRTGKFDAANACFLSALRLDPMNEKISGLYETINGRGMKKAEAHK